MFLTYKDLTKLFAKTIGIKDDLQFHTVSTESTFIQPKGLFVPLFSDSGELKEAIQNGAIGAVWEKGKELPAYVPNHFPVFFSNNLRDAMEKIIENYLTLIDGEEFDQMSMTKFLFTEEKLLKNNFSSYDKPVLKIVLKEERRG